MSWNSRPRSTPRPPVSPVQPSDPEIAAALAVVGAGRPEHHVLEEQAQVDVRVVTESDRRLRLSAQSAVGLLYFSGAGQLTRHRFCRTAGGGGGSEDARGSEVRTAVEV